MVLDGGELMITSSTIWLKTILKRVRRRQALLKAKSLVLNAHKILIKFPAHNHRADFLTFQAIEAIKEQINEID